MVTAYTERWASNVKLESTYWRGLQPLPHKHPAVSLLLRLTTYNAQKAYAPSLFRYCILAYCSPHSIKAACAALCIAPPLETEHDRPLVRHAPVIVGLARLAESGVLTSRNTSAGYSGKDILKEKRACLNESRPGMKPVEPEQTKSGDPTISSTEKACAHPSAKRAVSAPTEAHARRADCKHGRSGLRVDITAALLTGTDF